MSEQILEALDLIDLPACRTDQRFRILWANGAFTRRFGRVRGFLDIVREDALLEARDRLTAEETVALAHPVKGIEAATAEWSLVRSGTDEITFVAAAPSSYLRRVDTLERKNRQLEEFVYVVSHDLNEPLRMVTSFTQLLEEDYAHQLDDEARTYIKFACEGADRMRRLLLDLLSYSRINTRGKPFEPFDLKNAFESACEQVRLALDEAGAEITTSGDLGMTVGDRAQVVDLFVQLLKNAVQFRSPDASLTVHVEGLVIEGWRRVILADNGIGLDPAQHDRMLQIFKRLRPREGTGTGVGLALCRRIVERHGGTLRLESPAEGAGLRAVFTLPALS